MPQRDPNRRDLTARGGMEPGASVDVRSRYDGAWCSGFDIAEVVSGPAGPGDRRYRLRRVSDGAVLPRLFANHEVIPSRRDWR